MVNVYDALDRMVASYRKGSDGSQILQSQVAYDVLGRTLSETRPSPLGTGTVTTTYTYSVDDLVKNIDTHNFDL